MNESENQRLYDRQVKQLYEQTTIGIVATLVNAVILTFILFKVTPHSILLKWLTAAVLTSFLRNYLLYRYPALLFGRSFHWNFLAGREII